MLMLQEDDKAAASAGSSEATMRADEAPRSAYAELSRACAQIPVKEGKEEGRHGKSSREKRQIENFKKELSKLPKSLFKKISRALARDPQMHNRVYEMRATINGVLLYSCAADPEKCRERFLEELSEKILHKPKEAKKQPKAEKPKEIGFCEFALKWFNEIHRKKVMLETWQSDLAIWKKHIEKFFEGKLLREITTADCMQYLLEMKEKNIERTRENCDGLLRQIFDYAVASDLLLKSPMATIKRVKSIRENGVPLTKAEEDAFLNAIRGTKYEAVFLISLYTGLRPCEVETARMDGEFIVARNRKQKDVKRIVYKKIPITPMLAPHIETVRAALGDLEDLMRSETYVSDIFRKVCPGHRYYDLRTTFATRCQECGVPENVVQVWMGHSPRSLLGRVYTKLSDEYLLSEGKKVKY